MTHTRPAVAAGHSRYQRRMAVAVVVALAVAASCCCSAAAAAAAALRLRDVTWVAGLPNESHAAACSRMNRTASEYAVRLDAVWGPATIASVVAAVGKRVAAPVVRTCCTAGLWCNDTIGCYTGAAQNLTVFMNTGPLPGSSDAPVYSCVPRATGPQPAPPQVWKALPSPVRIGQPMTMYGSGFGNGSTLSVSVGAHECIDPVVCDLTCAPCQSSADCGLKECVYFPLSQTSVRSFCMDACGVNDTCPCGTHCHTFRTTSGGIKLCILLKDPYTPCPNRPSNWRPSGSSLECTVTGSCATNLTVSVASSGVTKSTYSQPSNASLPAVKVAGLETSVSQVPCTRHADCDDGDLCTVNTCVNGCCEQTASSLCTSQPPSFRGQGVNGVVFYYPVPKPVAQTIVPATWLASLPVGWFTTTSSASSVDDVPMDRVTLQFKFPFYDSTYSTVFISPNGYVQVTDKPVCYSYLELGCSFSAAYRGIIGPMIADFNPPATGPNNIKYRNTGTEFCVVWRNVMEYVDPDEVASPARFTFAVCLYPDGGVRYAYDRASVPTHTSVWMMGMRSPALPMGIPPSKPVSANSVMGLTEPFSPMQLTLSPEFAVDRSSQVFCAQSSLVCMSPVCGPAGTVVTLNMQLIGCGPSLTPTFSCIFGNVSVPAVVAVASKQFTCVVPHLPVEYGSSVMVQVAASFPGSGAGSVRLPVQAISPSGSTWQRQVLLYHYQPQATCGCSTVNASYTCQDCGVCGMSGRAISSDCTGTCLGTAKYDDCGVCSGGGTGKIPNSDKDCSNVCFGDDWSCVTSQPPVSVGPGISPVSPSDFDVSVAILVVFAIGIVVTIVFILVRWQITRRIHRQGEQQAAVTAAAEAPLSVEEFSLLPQSAYAPDKGAEEVPCPVCQDDLAAGQRIVTLPCRHVYHDDCISTWLLQRKPWCPLCKNNVRSGIPSDSQTREATVVDASTEPTAMSIEMVPPRPAGSGGRTTSGASDSESKRDLLADEQRISLPGTPPQMDGVDGEDPNHQSHPDDADDGQQWHTTVAGQAQISRPLRSDNDIL